MAFHNLKTHLDYVSHALDEYNLLALRRGGVNHEHETPHGQRVESEALSRGGLAGLGLPLPPIQDGRDPLRGAVRACA